MATATSTTPAVDQTPRNDRPYGVALVFLNIGALGLMGLLAPLTRELQAGLGMRLSTIGLIESLFLLVHVGATPVWGMLASHVSRQRLLLISTLTWSLCCGLIPLAGSPLWFSAAFLIAAVASAAVVPLSYSLMADVLPLHERGMNFGWLSAAQTLGVGLALLVGGTLAESSGWRGAFLVFSSIGFVLAILLMVRFNYEPVQGCMDGPIHERPVAKSRLKLRDIYAALRSRSNLPILLSGFLSMMPIGAVGFWFVAMLRNEHGLSSLLATQLMIGLFLVQVPGAVLLGLWADRLSRRWKRAKISLLLGFTAVSVPCYVGGFYLMGQSGAEIASPVFLLSLALIGVGALAVCALPPLTCNLVNDNNTQETRVILLSLVDISRFVGRAAGVQLTVLFATLFYAESLSAGIALVSLLFVPSLLLLIPVFRRAGREQLATAPPKAETQPAARAA